MLKLPPREALLIQRVHAHIAGQTWFNRNAVTETELLKLILRHHAGASRQEAELVALSIEEARARFSLTA
ncbi:MAG: hypothetical protein KL863_28240 [Rhizobium sp.]|jgi:hypothetical protein|nr:hypothetical protein [Rhizobium sp.]